MAEQTHSCPGGCGAAVPRTRLSCPPCWFRLPKPLRDDITAAYRNRFADSLTHARALSAASRWYRANPKGDD
jgi:hypothetical protein